MRDAPKSLFAGALDDEYLTRDQAKALADRVLAFAKADETRVNIASGWSGNTRFAGNEITTSGGTTNTTVTVTSTIGRRRASAQTNILDDASLKRTVELGRVAGASQPRESGADAGARSAGLRDGERLLRIDRRAGSGEARGGHEECHRRSRGGGWAWRQHLRRRFPRGQRRRQRRRDESRAVRVSPQQQCEPWRHRAHADGTGSGWSNAGARDWSVIDAAALGRTASQKAAASRNPRAIEPGLYTVVLEPAAVSDIMGSLLGTFNARANDEGRGTFSKQGGGTKLGEKIADERVTMYSDPADRDLLAQPFAPDGHAGASCDVHRERHPEGVLVRPVLGAEAGEGRDGRRRRWWWRRWRVRRRCGEVRRWHEERGRPDRRRRSAASSSRTSSTSARSIRAP